jgi:hypothetical protein
MSRKSRWSLLSSAARQVAVAQSLVVCGSATIFRIVSCAASISPAMRRGALPARRQAHSSSLRLASNSLLFSTDRRRFRARSLRTVCSQIPPPMTPARVMPPSVWFVSSFAPSIFETNIVADTPMSAQAPVCWFERRLYSFWSSSRWRSLWLLIGSECRRFQHSGNGRFGAFPT